MISQTDRIRSQLLVLRYRRGDNDALRELVTLWQRPLFYYVRRLVKSEEDAWDVLQETWIRVIRGIAMLRNSEKIPSWLYRIARNAAFNYTRDNPNLEPLSSEETNPASIESSEDQGFSAWNAEAIHWGLQQLPPAQGEVLTLFFLEDFSLREISSITSVSTGTVKSRLHYAKKALRGILEKEGSGHE